ncbi:MAG TPA: cation diffusion facilitator family transporter [Methanomassiliicoccales archaeon]
MVEEAGHEGHDEDHDHGHEHDHAHFEPGKKLSTPLLIVLIITATFAVVELLGGLISGSLALLSDAGHMFTDILALAMSLAAAIVSQREATAKQTFGYLRVEILVALTNGVALIFVSIFIMYEAVGRLTNPTGIDSELMLLVAIAGLAANVAGILVLRDRSKENLNVKGAFLHMLGDLLSSVGVIVAALLIFLFNLTIADPVISIAISLIIMYGAARLCRQSAYILLEFTPSHIELSEVRTSLMRIPGVEDVHDIHAWTISSGVYALSAHVRVSDQPVSACSCIVKACEHLLETKYQIKHSTLQLEYSECDMGVCYFKGFMKNGNNTNGKTQ